MLLLIVLAQNAARLEPSVASEEAPDTFAGTVITRYDNTNRFSGQISKAKPWNVNMSSFLELRRPVVISSIIEEK